MLGHIRSLQPPLHYFQIGELFQYRKFSIAHSAYSDLKDLSFGRNGARPDTESACVVTLSNIFDTRCKFHSSL